jgi:hypothetical protein
MEYRLTEKEVYSKDTTPIEVYANDKLLYTTSRSQLLSTMHMIEQRRREYNVRADKEIEMNKEELAEIDELLRDVIVIVPETEEEEEE